jgi:hypothetical protein
MRKNRILFISFLTGLVVLVGVFNLMNFVTVAEVGASCSGSGDCAADEYCPINMDQPTCKKKLGVEAVCYGVDDCQSGECAGLDDDGDSGNCEPIADGAPCFLGLAPACNVGSSCQVNPQTSQAVCTSQVCIEPTSCTDPNQYCDNGACVEKKGGASPCQENYECLSNVCSPSTKECTAPAGVAPVTPATTTPGADDAALTETITKKIEIFDDLGIVKGDISEVVGIIIKTVLGIIGSVALIMFVYGGIFWMTAGGSPDRIKKAREIFIWSALGLAIIFGSYVIVSYIIGAL